LLLTVSVIEYNRRISLSGTVFNYTGRPLYLGYNNIRLLRLFAGGAIIIAVLQEFATLAGFRVGYNRPTM